MDVLRIQALDFQWKNRVKNHSWKFVCIQNAVQSTLSLMKKASTAKQKRPSGMERFLGAFGPLAILSAVTLLAFANAWPNNLVLDDKYFVGPGRPHELDSVYYIFTHDLWASHEWYTESTGLYRPLLLLGFSVETWLFGNWVQGHHLSNIFLHLLVTILVFGFFRQLLRMTGTPDAAGKLYALLAALVFAVHPVHTEVVNSIFNRSDIMLGLFGLAGLWWLFHFLDTRRGLAWFGLGIAYFLGMLSKETAAVLPGIAVILILLLTPGDLSTRARKCLPVFWLLLPLALYLAMRFNALGAPAFGPVSELAGGDSTTSAGKATRPDNLLAAAGMLGASLKLLIWPYPLYIFHPYPSKLAELGYTVMQLILIVLALVQLQRKRFSLAAGLAFFYLAMLPASRIIVSDGTFPTLAERYIYFPSVGAAITFAFAIRAVAQRFGPTVVVNSVMPVLLVLTLLTWDRNADWADDITLFETDYRQGRNPNHDILRLLTDALAQANKHARVVEICDENLKLQKRHVKSSINYHCAVAYEKQHRLKAAERAYLAQIEYPRTRVLASAALAHFYLRQNRQQDAEKRFLDVIDWSEDPAEKALYRGEMIVSLYPYRREQLSMARSYLREALRLRPGWSKAENMLHNLDRALGYSNSSIPPDSNADPE